MHSIESYRMVAAGFLLFACSGPTPIQATDSGTDSADAGHCTFPLDECGDQCPPNEQAARDEAVEACGAPSLVSFAGQCGNYRYVEQYDVARGVIYYFDEQDQLAGVKITAAIPVYCDKTSTEITLGFIPDCVLVQDVDLCSL
ncbi:MAG: hypothetical protein JKY86_01245 [Gammaproteobacteria bacterium]|nr:hypothetical protein [Gammaproteobacteria bacterium]